MSKKFLLIWLIIFGLAFNAFADLVSDGQGHQEKTGLGSGGSGVVMTGATWTASGGSVYNTPTEGEELFLNTGFDTDANWTKGTGWTIDTADSNVAEGTATSSIIKQTVATVGSWYKFGITPSVNGKVFGYGLLNTNYLTTTPVTYVGRASITDVGFQGDNFTGTADNAILKPLTLSTLFLTAPLSTANVLASVEITKNAGVGTDGLQGGLVLNLDSAATPANFVIAYLSGTATCKMDKNVAGTYTNLISTATGCTYSAGKAMVVVKDATAYRLYYNNTFIGTQQTVSDAGIISNTIHGLFSTGAAQTLDDFIVYARGNEGQYGLLNQFVN